MRRFLIFMAVYAISMTAAWAQQGKPLQIKIPSKLYLMYDKTKKIIPKVFPEGVYSEVTWSSDNPTVASVSPDGIVSALYPGIAVITATTQNGKTAICSVEVEKPKFSFVLSMNDGNCMNVAMDDHPVVYSKNNLLILETNKSVMKFGLTDVCKFTIVDNNVEERMPEQIKMAPNVDLQYGTGVQLVYNLYPIEYEFLTDLTWASSNSNIVSVSDNGEIFAKSPGEAIITATASNGTKATCVVNVSVPAVPIFLYLRDGRYETLLSKQFKCMYDNNKLIVTTDDGEVSCDAINFKKICFVEDESSIVTDINEELFDKQPQMSIINGKIRLQDLNDGSLVYVYSSNGQMIKSCKSSSDNDVELSLEDFQKGIYIIKSNKITFKFLKK